MIEELKEIEEELKSSYDDNRKKKEKEAIKTLLKNPKFFYSYQKHFSKTNEKMSGFITKEGEIISDPFRQSEMLREQYQSVYSQPDPRYQTSPQFFTGCQDCAAENVHECGEDVWNYPGAKGQDPGSCSHSRGVKTASEREEAAESEKPDESVESAKSEKPGESVEPGSLSEEAAESEKPGESVESASLSVEEPPKTEEAGESKKPGESVMPASLRAVAGESEKPGEGVVPANLREVAGERDKPGESVQPANTAVRRCGARSEEPAISEGQVEPHPSDWLSGCPDCRINTIVGLGPDDWLADYQFSSEDFSAALDKLSSTAAPGPDGIPAKMLKNGKSAISHILYHVFKTSFDSGDIPELLKRSYIIPIHKGGSKAQPENYRNVSLTSHLVKTFERVLVKALVSYLEFKGKMDPRQHGSRAGRSTLSQLLLHFNLILKALEEGKNVDAIYLDFAKAFDKVDHGLLLHKIKSQGIKGKMGRWIQNFLEKRTNQVLVDGKMSSCFFLKSGIPQGSVLGPFLFLAFISDIAEDLEGEAFVYVDDTKTVKMVETEEDVENHQKDLNRLDRWSKENNMEYNATKFVLLRYGKNTDLKEDTVYFSGDMDEVIEEKESTKDLGVIMQNDATFSEQIEKVCCKVRQKSGWMFRTFYSRKGWFLRHMWNSLIQCHIDYCSQLWAPGEGAELQKLEKLLKDYLAKVPELNELPYWEKLSTIKMNSQQRRLERYRIIYVWKTLEGKVPDCGVYEATGMSERLGRKCKIPALKPKVRIKRDNSFQVAGPKLFNAMPKEVRNISCCGVEDFKKKLDSYLNTIPDEPKIGGLMPQNCYQSNSILYQVARAGERKRKCG